MTHQNRVATIAAGHTESVNTVFQVFTIALVGLFTLVALLDAAVQLV